MRINEEKMPMEAIRYIAGVDLGGTFIKCGIVDSCGTMVKKGQVPTDGTYDNVVSAIIGLAADLAKEADVPLSGIGIGAPGTVDSETGTIVYSNNLRWDDKPLAADICQKTGLPVAVTNDANAAALGEYAYGAGKEYNTMVLITLGTGVGGGIVLDGKLFEGFRGAGAELGHMVIRDKGLRCTCGRRGCLEAYASAGALVRRAKAYMEKHEDTILWQLCEGDREQANGKILFEAVRRKDAGACKVLQGYLDDLACGLTNFANIFRPEAIVLGGGISAAGRLLTEPLQRKMDRQMFGGAQYAPVKIVTAELQNDAGIYGAAQLLMQ